MTAYLPTYDPRALAAALKARDLPGARSMTAIKDLRRTRTARRATTPTPPLTTRFLARLTAAAVAEIARRGGETAIESQHSAVTVAIADRDPAARMLLMHAAGWRWYGTRAKPRPASLSYLVGRDDAGPWAVRVPGTITTVAGAQYWIMPATVRDAIAAGRLVRRQGDVYAIETTGDDDTGELPAAHRFNPATRYLTHRPEDGRRHRPVRVPFTARFVQQRVYAMGRGGTRTCGD